MLARALLEFGEAGALDAARHLREAVRMNPRYNAATQLLAEILARTPSVRGELEEVSPTE